MNPNSTHQLWSLWTATILVTYRAVHTREEFKDQMRNACARVYRKLFGSASEMKITVETVMAPGLTTKIVVKCRTEGAPAPDMAFRKRQMAEIGQFFGRNLRHYGTVRVHVDVFVEAGDAGDGKPPAQVIYGPNPALLPKAQLGWSS